MRYRGAALLLLLLIVVTAMIATRGYTSPMPPYHEIPIDQVTGKPLPHIGLGAPLPNWIPLPERGYVSGAELFAPHLPYGPGAVIVLRYDETQAQFVVNYRHRLERAGFVMRRIPILFHLIIDKPDAAYEADEENGGRVGYIVLRHARKGRFAQLTFYDPPAPRLHL